MESGSALAPACLPGMTQRWLWGRLPTGELRLPPRRACRDRSRRGAVLDTELGVDLLQVLVDGARAEAQDLRDVAIGLALGEPGQHLALTRRQAEFARER